MCNINKSETTTKRDVDEWIDGEGNFHRKTVIETITSPMNTRDAVNPNKINHMPGFFRQTRGIVNPMKIRFPIKQIREPKQFFGNNMSDKPLIDFKTIMEQGKKILEASGMKLEDLFKPLTGVKVSTEKSLKEIKEEIKEEIKKEEKDLNQKKEVKTWQKTKKQKLKKQNQKKKK